MNFSKMTTTQYMNINFAVKYISNNESLFLLLSLMHCMLILSLIIN